MTDLFFVEIKTAEELALIIDTETMNYWKEKFGSEQWIMDEIKNAFQWTKSKSISYDNNKRWLEFLEGWLTRSKDYRTQNKGFMDKYPKEFSLYMGKLIDTFGIRHYAEPRVDMIFGEAKHIPMIEFKGVVNIFIANSKWPPKPAEITGQIRNIRNRINRYEAEQKELQHAKTEQWPDISKLIEDEGCASFWEVVEKYRRGDKMVTRERRPLFDKSD